MVLEHHGLVTWGEEHERSYGDTVELAARARAYLDAQGPCRPGAGAPDLPAAETARLLAALRARLSAGGRRKLLHVDVTQRDLADRDDVEAVAAGRGTPDHLLRIGTRSVVVRERRRRGAAVDAFERDYRAYFDRHRRRLPDGFGMLEPLPRVVLVPGLGAVAAGPDPETARVTAEIAHRSHLVVARTLDAFGRYAWLSGGGRVRLRLLADGAVQADARPAAARPRGLVVVAPPAVPEGVGEALSARGAVLAADDAEASRLGGADALLVPDGGSLSVERDGRQAFVVDGGEPAAIGEAVAFALAGRAPLRAGAHLELAGAAA